MSRLAAFAERHAPRILAILIALFILVFFAAAVYKYETFGYGYDQVDFEQAIWNTTQGRPFEDSRFNYTDSVFGLDWMPMLALFVPLYALLPSPHTLFFLQIVAAALGAVPVYLLARDRIGGRLPGLAFGILWLLYPTIEALLLEPFQVRIFATSLLLLALLFFERGQLWPFLGAAALAMTARSDVSLVVIMFSVYGLFTRRRWPFVLAPLLLGGTYFLAVMTFVVPNFVHLPDVECRRIQDPELLARAWPGNKNPNLGYYLHWGCTPGEILVNLVRDPLYTLYYMFLEGGGRKIGYLAAMLAPFGFLALLNPRGLLLSLPILGLNLIAWRSGQTNHEQQYSLLVTVGVIAASIHGYRRLAGRLARRESAGTSAAGPGGRPADGGSGVRLEQRMLVTSLLLLLLFALGVNLLLRNPVASAILYPEPPRRVAAARELIAMVPPEARVAASSKLAPHLLPRRYIYNFPPAPYSPYTMDNFGPLEYILVDPGAVALAANPLASGRTALQELEASPEWELLREAAGFRLYRRR